MKIKELKEMIKAAFVAEETNAQYFYEPMEEAYDELEENLTKDQIQKKYNEMFGKNPQTKFADVAKALNTTEQEIAAALFSLPMFEADKVDEAEEEKSLDDMLADLMAEDLNEAEEEEEVKVKVDAEEEVEDEGGEEKSDSIVVDKKIVSLSSLPNDTRKILDSLETLRAQAEEFGDQKFITQVGNTITFFTRDFVVAGDEPTKAKVDEIAFPMWNKIK